MSLNVFNMPGRTVTTSKVPSSPGSSVQLQLLIVVASAERSSLLVVNRGVSIPPYRTYMQSFNFRSVVLFEIAFHKKALLIITQLPSQSSTIHPVNSI